MNYLIKSIAFLIIFLSYFPYLNSQVRDDTINLCQLEVNILLNKPIQTYAGRSPFSTKYQGELVEGIANLYGIPLVRVKASKNAPTKYINYNIFTNYLVSSDLTKTAIKVLEDGCEFKIREIKDTCDIWKITVIDSSKLVPFSFEKDSPNGITGIGSSLNNIKDIELFGQTLTATAKWFEIVSKKYIFISESVDTGYNALRYKFIIPLEFVQDIEILMHFMKEKYGILFIKEKGIIEKLFLEFKSSD
jgi:hypothetical protein